MSRLSTAAALAAAAVLAGQAAPAQDTGAADYMDACATCHGATGAGDGPLAGLMTVPVPPLTGLGAANGGVFPLVDVVKFIDGRSGIRGHGYPMPVWGSRFRAETGSMGDQASEIRTRERIMALARHIESLQE